MSKLNRKYLYNFFYITQFLNNVQRRGGRIGVFPVSEGSWQDIGQRDDYIKLLSNYFMPNL